MYALLGLTLILSTWVFWRAWQGVRWQWWVAFGILSGVAMYVQQLAALYLLALGLLPVLCGKRHLFIKTGLAASVSLVVYFPWMLKLPGQMGKLRHYWVQRPNVLHLWLTLRSFVSVNLDFSPEWWLPTFMLAAVLTVMSLLQGWRALRRNHERDAGKQALKWALWLAFMPMIFMWVVSYVFQPVFLPRALLPSGIIYLIVVAWLVSDSGIPREIASILFLGWAGVAIFGLTTHYSWDTFPNSPFDDAVDHLAENVESGDVVIHANKLSALPMVYYNRDLVQRYVRDIPGSGSDTLAGPTQEVLGLVADDCVARAASGAPRVWFVTFERLQDEMIELVADDPSNARYDSLRWLREHYRESSRKSFNDLQVILFREPDPEALLAECE